MEQLITIEKIESKIFLLRGRRVMLDEDLAMLYEVKTKQLTRQVQRNIKRFPDDFMFLLTKQEVVNLRCQIGTSSWGGRIGVAMLSSVLNSERAIQVNIQIMRAFVNLKRSALNYAGLKRKIEDIEKKYDAQFSIVFQVIKKLLIPPVSPKPERPLGFDKPSDR